MLVGLIYSSIAFGFRHGLAVSQHPQDRLHKAPYALSPPATLISVDDANFKTKVLFAETPVLCTFHKESIEPHLMQTLESFDEDWKGSVRVLLAAEGSTVRFRSYLQLSGLTLGSFPRCVLFVNGKPCGSLSGSITENGLRRFIARQKLPLGLTVLPHVENARAAVPLEASLYSFVKPAIVGLRAEETKVVHDSIPASRAVCTHRPPTWEEREDRSPRAEETKVVHGSVPASRAVRIHRTWEECEGRSPALAAVKWVEEDGVVTVDTPYLPRRLSWAAPRRHHHVMQRRRVRFDRH